MPRIAEFDGVIILLYYDDHHPPHVHVRYGSHQALMQIDPASIAAGALPRRVEQQVLAWATRRMAALQANWDRAQRHQPLEWIDP
ncbi:DUF4160 domain-containing protein [Candidatus Chloroploca sp. Khr17]|uniref:DUF4160 domain-containing protein n=1 Tax=Candidatus Chloroploca sp. Khr17 TaxID=2496869 RepID=UPI00101CFC22|nr:DUF4160 domain-containing protein [Candidatus Chloroploca sp. Khr17]